MLLVSWMQWEWYARCGWLISPDTLVSLKSNKLGQFTILFPDLVIDLNSSEFYLNHFSCWFVYLVLFHIPLIFHAYYVLSLVLNIQGSYIEYVLVWIKSSMIWYQIKCCQCITSVNIVWDTFTKLQKATISCIMSVLSVCPSVRNSSDTSGQILMKFDIWGFFKNLWRKFKFH